MILKFVEKILTIPSEWSMIFSVHRAAEQRRRSLSASNKWLPYTFDALKRQLTKTYGTIMSVNVIGCEYMN